MDKRSSLEIRNNFMSEEQNEESDKKKVEDTIQKWLSLQKTVKEEITLEDIIINQQKEDFKKLQEYFYQYYTLKISSRKIYEDMRKLKAYQGKKTNDKSEENKKKSNKENYLENEIDYKDFCIENDIDKVLFQACEPIKNLLFLFRNDYDYITQLISLIDDGDEKEEIESLVELFCNQFYDNILIPNPEQEELLILIYKLLETEISQMNSASTDEFMHDSTFLGKFISSFTKKQELNVFLSILLNPLIASIENKNDKCLDMSLFSIQKIIQKKKEDENRQEIIKSEEDKKAISDFLLGNIPKTKIHFKNKKQIEEEKEKQNQRTNYKLETQADGENQTEGETPFGTEASNNNSLKLQLNDSDSKSEEEKHKYNEEYMEMLTQEKLNKILRGIKDNDDLKAFYEHQLEQINSDPDIFSNEGILAVLNENYFEKVKFKILDKYKKNFLFIQEKVDTIIQALIDKITSIPYTVRCISKMISILISKKFPLLAKYLQNSFIGKFIFNKCLFPVLSLENKNVVENTIFNTVTKKCLNVIISVLSTANKCSLFNSNTDTEKTIFNYYILEIMPILNKFYEKLIDIELPKTLNDLVSKTKEKLDDNLDEKIFSFIRKECTTSGESSTSGESTTSTNHNTPTPSYDYFTENSDEILKVQCICFSLTDILFIMNLISKDNNYSKFKPLPKFDSFRRTVERIRSEEHKLDKQKTEEKKRRFFLIFKDEKNSQLEKLFRQKNKKKKKEENDMSKEVICSKIKDSIKTILKGLNILNNKDYSYLNMATSNEKFLQAIRYTLDDISEFSESENEIPLNWYGQFIENHKKSLDPKYLENDLNKLYHELFNEETNILNELKSFSSIIITRDGMNLRCAEKIIEKCKSDNRRMEKAKQIQKIEFFIENEKTEVCIRIKEKDDGKNEKEKSIGLKGLFGKKEKEEKNIQFQFVTLLDPEKCPHKNAAFMSSIEGEKKKKISAHAYTINDFISKFKTNREKPNHDLDLLMQFIQEDIRTGTDTHQIFKAFNEYKQFLKNRNLKSSKYIDIDKIKEKYEKDKNEKDEKDEKEPKKEMDKENEKEMNKEIENEMDKFVGKLEDHIMKKIYEYVFPKEPLDEDRKFYKKVRLLEWVGEEKLDIKKSYVSQLKPAILYIKKMDEEKSISDKIKCIEEAHNCINNVIKFSSGKNENAGADEITPIFYYIVMKAQPKRVYSNINYIKCFMDQSQGSSNTFLLTRYISAVEFVMNLDYSNLRMSKEEFNKNMEEVEKKYEESENKKKNKNKK